MRWRERGSAFARRRFHGGIVEAPQLGVDGVGAAAGLVVAAVVLPFHNFFAGRIAAQTRALEVAGSVVVETFSEMERMGTKA